MTPSELGRWIACSAVLWVHGTTLANDVQPAVDSHMHCAGDIDAEPDALAAGHAHHQDAGFVASLALVVADYDAYLFSGDYQGAIPSVGWRSERVGLSASLPLYRLSKNGLVVEGPGDAMLHVHMTAITRTTASAGFVVMMSAPTGNDRHGLGMGHVMVMPGGWATWSTRKFMVSGGLAFHRALGSARAHSDHGQSMWPLVDPMNAVEVAGSITGMIALARPLALGARAEGATPIGSGEQRLTVGVRAVWVTRRTETSAAIDRGVLGQPFGLRGTLTTSVRFR